jgi:Fe-S cluster assembly scaffold protein SufB
VQVHIAAGGELHLINAQLVPDDKAVTSRVKVYVGKGAKFRYTTVEAGARHTAAELSVDMAGDDSISDIWGLYFGDGASKIDLNYVIRQQGRRTDANMQVRGALLGTSDKIFRGTLDFLEGSKGSVGRENEEVVLLSPTVRNRSVPVMLSHEDDVDGHHAVSVGKIDEGKLFYLMSRGLDMADAQRLIVEASFHPVLDRIEDEALKEEIDKVLMGRLANG